MDAIVYTSNSGFTKEYAEMMSQKTGLPVFSLTEAKGALKSGAEILYFGWLMAGSVKGYSEARQKYKIRAVCAVGMAKSGSQMDDVKKHNHLPETLPLFTLQGGFDLNRLHGIYKFMMNAMTKGVGKKLSAKQNKTPDEEDMLDLMLHGGDRVSLENLTPVLNWYQSI
ncbi:hypothetical protein ACVS9P_04485 [Caproicibacterium sp. NSD3]